MKNLPAWIKELFDKGIVPTAPEVFNIALEWLVGVQTEFLASSPSKVLDELRGIAQVGRCAATVVSLSR